MCGMGKNFKRYRRIWTSVFLYVIMAFVNVWKIKHCFVDFSFEIYNVKGTSFLFQLESHIISFTIKNNSKTLLIQFGIKVRVVWAPFLILKYEPNTAAIFRHIFIIHNRILIYSIIHELVTKQRQERTNIEYDRVK